MLDQYHCGGSAAARNTASLLTFAPVDTTLGGVNVREALDDGLQARWNRENLAVYADALITEGDVRGELIPLDLQSEPRPLPISGTGSGSRYSHAGSATSRPRGPTTSRAGPTRARCVLSEPRAWLFSTGDRRSPLGAM